MLMESQMSTNKVKNSKAFEPLFVKEENDVDIPKTEGRVTDSQPDTGICAKVGIPGKVNHEVRKKEPTPEDSKSSSGTTEDDDETEENDADEDEDNSQGSSSYESESSDDSSAYPPVAPPLEAGSKAARPIDLVVGQATVTSCASKAAGEHQKKNMKVQDEHSSNKQGNSLPNPLNGNPAEHPDVRKSLQKMPSMDFKSINTLDNPSKEDKQACEKGQPEVIHVQVPAKEEQVNKISPHAFGEKLQMDMKKRGQHNRKNYGLSTGRPPVPPTSPLPSMVFQAPVCNSVYGINMPDHSMATSMNLQCHSCLSAGYQNVGVNRWHPGLPCTHAVRCITSPPRQMNEGTVYSLALEMPISGASNVSHAVRKKKQGRKRYPASLPDDTCGCAFSPIYFSDMYGYNCSCQSQRDRAKTTWTRASVERDCNLSSANSSARNNRHSSYTPHSNPIGSSCAVNDSDKHSTTSKAYPRTIHLSRPNSPPASTINSAEKDLKESNSESCNRTFPRSLSRAASCRHCHVGCNNGSVVSLGGSLLGLDYEDRLLRLESDKDTLHLQVSVLSDQIEAQTSKIQDLEKMLDDKRNTLETTEEQLQRELVTRSSLETQKLELITEISGLRLKQATLERENLELKGKFGNNCVRSLTDLNSATGEKPVPWYKPPVAAAAKIRDSSPHAYAHPNNAGRLRLTSITNKDSVQSHPPRMQTPPATSTRRVEVAPSYSTIPRLSQSSLQPGKTFVSNNNGSNRNAESKTSMIAAKTNSLSSGSLNQIVNQANANNLLSGFDKSAKASKNGNESGTTTKSMKILRIFGKLRRSNSGALEVDGNNSNDEFNNPEKNPFVRGGFRATAAPRLGWAFEGLSPRMPDGPISSWDCAGVVNWLNYLGLGMYANEMRCWVKSGQQLLDASSGELEKELGIKNTLHKKKLSLALYYLQHPDEEDNAGKLDYHWVTRWLDDVGLPQYKESFADARVDGRVLSNLTTEDLLSLKVTSLLHHVSLKRGIQILRIHRFHPGCLCRRGSITEFKNSLSNDPRFVATWTNHRVMEWLKAVDLAEYAPNLRGSGVHGALIVLEPKFNAELLAILLSIPTNKTLLRRHLCQQFSDLVGKSMVEEKRTYELAADFIPLSLTAKVKQTKKTFPLRKKAHNPEAEELVCPADLCNFPIALDGRKQLSLNRNDLDRSADKTSNL